MIAPKHGVDVDVVSQLRESWGFFSVDFPQFAVLRALFSESHRHQQDLQTPNLESPVPQIHLSDGRFAKSILHLTGKIVPKTSRQFCSKVLVLE